MNDSPTAAATRTRIVVLAALCAAAVVAYITRNAIGAAETTVRADLGLTREQSGWLMSAFFWPYALCQIPGAWFGQRLGSQRSLPIFSIVWSLATALTAVGGFAVFIVSRVAQGVSQAGLVPMCTGVMARWFPRTSQAFASGLFSGFMSVGATIAAPLTAWLVVTTGWRWMFVLYAIPGLLWAAWFEYWFRDRPSEHASVNRAELDLIRRGAVDPAGASPAAGPTPWRRLVRSPAMWFLCAQQVCRAAGYIFFASWFTTYLQEARGMTLLSSGIFTMLPFLGDVAGSLAGGALSDAVLRRTGSLRLARQGITVVAMGVCALLIFASCLLADAFAAVLLISAGSFLAGLGNPCAGAITMEMGGARVATVMSTMNMCGNLGAAAFPVFVPWLLHWTGSWNAVLLSFGSLYVAAALCWWLLDPGERIFGDARPGSKPALPA